jgi:putative tryptophan/tyrosine transport system substrate-binding protein
MKKAAVPSILVVVMLLAVAVVARAQQPAKVPRIGFLFAGSFSPQSPGPRLQAFREKLRELGYIEGQNIAIEYRYAEGKSDLLPELARELVRQEVSIIVTTSTSSLMAAKQATSKLPLFAATSGDLIGTGLVASLARPGGNVTGLTAISPELSGKRLELLKEIVPRILRVAVLWHPSKWDEKEVRETEIAAPPFGLKVQSVQVRSANEFQTAYAAISKEGARAIIIIQGPFTSLHRKKIVELTAENQLPSICDAPDWVDHGCLASYGPNRADLYRRAAAYVDKILKGAKPADLPVEQPTKFELVINLKTAKQIGVTIPPNVLARADKVIK